MAHQATAPAGGGVRLPVLAPMLATPAPGPPTAPGWAFEVKWDGVRALAYLDGTGALRLHARSGIEITTRYPELAGLPGHLPAGTDAIFDGEITALGHDGRPDFRRLQDRMHLTAPYAITAAAERVPVTLILFDLLWHRERSLVALPYTQRRDLLDGLAIAGEHVRTPPMWRDAGDLAMDWTRQLRLEGIVAKRLASPYRPGRRTPEWIKVRHTEDIDVVIGGWVPSEADPEAVASVLIGVPEKEGSRLRYVGHVGTGLTQRERRWLARELREVAADASPFADNRDIPHRATPTRWTRPVLRAQIEYLNWTPAGRLRHPVWHGLLGAE